MAKYVVYREDTSDYLCIDVNGYWVQDIKNATKFKAEETAKNTLDITYKRNFEVIRDKLSIVEYDAQIVEACDAETAAQMFNDLSCAMSAMTEVIPYINQLIKYYSFEQQKCDQMQEDILHKIEFDNIVGITAVRLVNQLKEIRSLRREAKDKLMLLQNIKTSQVVMLGNTIQKITDSQNSRKYNPRVLKELFSQEGSKS